MKTTGEKLDLLARIAARFNSAGLTWALGASAMLYLRGITDDFRDIDLSVWDGDADTARDILLSMGTQCRSDAGEHYRTRHFYEFTVNGVEVDVMGGFAVEKDGVVYDCSLDPRDISGSASVGGQTIPLHSLQAWRRYYQLMGRPAKVRLIDTALEKEK